MVSTSERQKITSEIGANFQILITLGMFFPALVYYFVKVVGQTERQSGSAYLSWVWLVFFFVLDYVLYVIFESRLADKTLARIRNFLLGEICLFVYPIGVMASKGDQMGPIAAFQFKTALWLLQVIPIVLICIIFFAASGRKIWTWVTHPFRKGARKLFQRSAQ